MFPDVNTKKAASKSGRPSAGFDHYSGMIFYGAAPVVSGKWQQYATTPVVSAQQLFSATDAKLAGIVPFTDNVAATSTYTITTKGATGDTLELIIPVPKPNNVTQQVSLGSYLVPAGSATIQAQATDYAALVNSGTAVHGFSATVGGAAAYQITLSSSLTFGKSLNGVAITESITGAFVGTKTPFANGTASTYAMWFYHIAWYFWKNPNGNVWVGLLAASSSFNEIGSLQEIAGGKLRQIGIFDDNTARGTAANIRQTLLQVSTAAKKTENKAPLIVVYSPNIRGVSLSDYPDQNINIANDVQCVISQDGNAGGALLYITNQQSIGNMGIKLATIAISRVSASDAQPDATLFNNSDGTENDVTAFSNGVLQSNVQLPLQYQLDTYRYTFFRKLGDQVIGTYWVDNKTCVSSVDEYCFVNDNRVFQKISRICQRVLVPKLSSELIFNTDGTLQNFTIEGFISLVNSAVTADMVTGQGSLPMISGFEATIDPSQNVRDTSNLNIDCTVVENGISRDITVKIGYGTL